LIKAEKTTVRCDGVKGEVRPWRGAMNRLERFFFDLEYAARESAKRSYCPYSKFAVGAAVLTAGGRIFAGCNVENASFGLSICAERVAVFRAIAEGERTIEAVAVYTPTPEPVMPCGACLQVLSEFGPSATVVSICDGGDRMEAALHLLLPRAFGLSDPYGSPSGHGGGGRR
jgi:cytidine deaminase